MGLHTLHILRDAGLRPATQDEGLKFLKVEYPHPEEPSHGEGVAKDGPQVRRLSND